VDHQRQRGRVVAGPVQPCNVVLVDQFLDRTKKSLEHTFSGAASWRTSRSRTRFARSCGGCCSKTRGLEGARHDGGTYVTWRARFSTRAESLTNHRLGYDVIGMTISARPNARARRKSPTHHGHDPDYDCWKVDEAHVTVEMVVQNLTRNAALAKEVVKRTIPKFRATQTAPAIMR